MVNYNGLKFQKVNSKQDKKIELATEEQQIEDQKDKSEVVHVTKPTSGTKETSKSRVSAPARPLTELNKVVSKLAPGHNMETMNEGLRSFRSNQKLNAPSPACSTIVLTDGKTIQARNIKVSTYKITYESCGENKEISAILRTKVERIIPTIDPEKMNTTPGDDEVLNKNTVAVAAAYFIASIVFGFVIVFLLIDGFLVFPTFLGFLGAFLGLFLLLSALNDFSAIRGISLTIAGFVVYSILALISLFLLVDENN